MNIEKTFTDDHQVKLLVTIDQERLDTAKQKVARKVAQKTKIPGFRPGKAPYAVIVRTVGEAALLQEAVDFILENDYAAIVKEAEIKAYSAGSLDNIISVDPLKLEFTIPLDAEVSLGDYKSIRFPYALEPISEERIGEFFDNLLDRSSTLEPVDRAAQEGDVVFLTLGADRKNPEEGQGNTLIKDRSTQITIKPDESNPNEWPYPGFSRLLIGAVSGDEANYEYTYTDDTSLDSLKGTTALFRYKIEAVKERKVPALDDEFAKSMGEFETLEAMRAEVEKGLEEQARMEYDREYDNKIFEVLIPQSTIKYPPQMLDSEIDMFKHQLEHRLEDQGLDMSTYMKSRQIDEAGLIEELRPNAENRLKRSLILFEVAKTENITVDESQVQAEAIQTLTEINQTYDPKEVKKMMTEQFIQNMIGNITSDHLIRNSLKRLEMYAKGETLPEESTSEDITSGEIDIEGQVSEEPSHSEDN